MFGIQSPEARAAESATEVLQCIEQFLADATAQWSVGSFGAIAEFLRDPEEAVELGPLSVATARGALSFTPCDGLKLVAFETTTRDSWSQRVALCLSAESARMSMRNVLTEVGPDHAAARGEDRTGVLFDVGVGVHQLDLCVRVADAELVRMFRAECGKPTFSHESRAGQLIHTHSPHRVFITRLARAEVYQAIPPVDGKSPDGPHTHVLYDLLKHKRTHAATDPIPKEYVPCAFLYPAHPERDAQGHAQRYDRDRKDAFDLMLARYGDGELFRLKQKVIEAVEQRRAPSTFRVGGRFARTTIRVTLRQLRASGYGGVSLGEWLAAFEPRPREWYDEDLHVHHR